MQSNYLILSKYYNTMLALKNERWEYIAAFLISLFLALFLVGELYFRAYDLSQLVVNYNHTKTKLATYQHALQSGAAGYKFVGSHSVEIFEVAPIVSGSASGNHYLIGINYSISNPRASQVIISDKSGNEDIYKVGDNLPGGGVIQNIGIDSVMVLINGKLEKLTLAWDEIDSDQTKSKPAYMNPMFHYYQSKSAGSR